MIEYSELAKEAIITIAPYLTIGGTEIIKDISSDLWTSIKSVFKKENEKELLTEFEKNPSDIATQAKIEYVLENELKTNDELTKTLSELIKSVQATEEYKNYISQVGDNNISIQGKVANSKINIKK